MRSAHDVNYRKLITIMGRAPSPGVAIFENDKDMVMLLQSLCAMAGYEVVGTASNFDDALQIIEDKHPRFAILDYYNRGGRNGLQFIEEARSKQPDLVTIMVTGWDINDIAARSEPARPDRLLRKPVHSKKFVDMLASLELHASKGRKN